MADQSLFHQAQNNNNQSSSEEFVSSGGREFVQRGILLLREQRDIGTLRGTHGDKVKLITSISRVASIGKDSVGYGVRFEHEDAEGNTQSSCYLDFSVLAELVRVSGFLIAVAKRLIAEERDYTEVKYTIGDEIVCGFYQSNRQQSAFVCIDNNRGDNCFFLVPKYESFQSLVEAARTHLLSKGAKIEDE